MDDAEYQQKCTERYALLAYLNRVRDAVARIPEGLTEEQVRKPGVPSGTTRDQVVAAYARQAGHADILREQIDGVTGL